MALADYAISSGLEDLNDEEKMNKLLAALIADEEPEISASAVRQHPFLPSLLQIRNNPTPGYGLHGTGGDDSLYRGSTTSGDGGGGGDQPNYRADDILTPWDYAMMTPHEILTSHLLRERKKGYDRFWDPNDPSDKKRAKEAMKGVVKGLPKRIREEVDPAGVFSASGIKQLVDWFGNWLVKHPPGGGSTPSGGGSDGGDGGGGTKLSPEEIEADGQGMFSQSSSSDGGGGAVPTKSREENYTFEDLEKSAGKKPYKYSGLEDLNDPSETMFNRVINRVSIPPDDGGGMLIPLSEAPGRDLSSSMDSGLEGLNAKEESVSSTDMETKLGFPTEKEPELFGTFLKALLGKGMFQDVEFKPWDLNLFEDRMNEAPLVERWAAQMKEEIGWQYMTPAERKDYIKKNKHDKNNTIIMDYNMYRRRRK
jgi:hypothetical protein